MWLDFRIRLRWTVRTKIRYGKRVGGKNVTDKIVAQVGSCTSLFRDVLPDGKVSRDINGSLTPSLTQSQLPFDKSVYRAYPEGLLSGSLPSARLRPDR